MEDCLDSIYQKVVKGYGQKIFGKQTQDERDQKKETLKHAYDAFVKTLSGEERKCRGDSLPGEKDHSDDSGDDDDDDD